MMNIRSNRKWLIGIGIIVMLGIGWALFRPELLFIDKKVDEPFPDVPATSAQTSQPEPPAMPGVKMSDTKMAESHRNDSEMIDAKMHDGKMHDTELNSAKMARSRMHKDRMHEQKMAGDKMEDNPPMSQDKMGAH
jgi:hypothetical protein